jgi:hypothetical protein
MSSEATETTPIQWTVEEYYLGSANYPSEATYRWSRDRLQEQVKHPVTLQRSTDRQSFTGSVDNVAQFLSDYQDVQLLVHPSRTSARGTPVAPSLYLIGWKDVDTEEGRRQYELDKKFAMTKRES